MALVSGFYRGSPIFPVLLFRRCSILTSITVIIFQHLATAKYGSPRHLYGPTEVADRTSDVMRADAREPIRALNVAAHRVCSRDTRRTPLPSLHNPPPRSHCANNRTAQPGDNATRAWMATGILRNWEQVSSVLAQYLLLITDTDESFRLAQNQRASSPGSLDIPPGDFRPHLKLPPAATGSHPTARRRMITSNINVLRDLFSDSTGATVAERLARSPPTKAIRVQSPTGSPYFRMWKSCRTMPLVGSAASSFRHCSILTSIALIGSEDLACDEKCIDEGRERETSAERAWDAPEQPGQ
ncbi:hypothetical protein PR048_014749 [Dryococelus australis]|uniref:Uncharacterized protein n=1 Tax=Dryococelus australis TaxID=614101 RepID=A0ABQ9HF91_9NEOP|nr:hypothetical protein PR048_014749 [Dryococelus australis]